MVLISVRESVKRESEDTQKGLTLSFALSIVRGKDLQQRLV